MKNAPRQPAPSEPSVAVLRTGPTILLLNPSGWGNLGDAAILDATIASARLRWPGVRLVGVTLAPGDTEQRHGIEAHLLAARSLGGYGVIPRSSTREFGRRDTSLPGATRLQRVPLLRRPVGFLNDAVLTLLHEPAHTRDAARLVRAADLLVVAGGGQFDEYWGGAWGHPFALAKWSKLAEASGTPFVILSVGVCELRSWLARHFCRKALRRAVYSSFRDPGSRDRARALARSDRPLWIPDLAYGVELPVTARPVESSGEPRSIGLSPIAYRDPRAWPHRDPEFFAQYVRRMADIASGLVRRGHEVSLFTSDAADWAVVEDILEALEPNLRTRVAAVRSLSVPAFLAHAAGLDLVIASRLHGLLLSQVAGRPTLALSYDPKVDALMADFEQQEYCLPLETTSAPELLALAESMLPLLPKLQQRTMARVARHREAVARQFTKVWDLHEGGAA